MVADQLRSQVPVEEQWNQESVFATPEAWQAEAEALPEVIAEVARFRGHLGESASILLDGLREQERVMGRAGKVRLYAQLNADADATNQTFAALRSQGTAVYNSAAVAFSFFEAEILAIGRERLDAEMTQTPALATYAHYFDTLFRKQRHVRSAEVEELLEQARDPLDQGTRATRTALTSADMTFRNAHTADGTPVAVFAGSESALFSPDRELRRTWWESYQDGHLALKNTLASNVATAIKRDVFYARAHRYSSSLEAALSAENIPVSVFTTTIETFQRHLPTWHRYWGVLRRAMGAKKLYGYDMHAPLASTPPVLEFSQAVEWLCAALRPLGDDYVAALRRGCLDERWVDRAVNRGKREGAYSSGVQGTFPFIMMSYDGSLIRASTLAHELGHSMHSYLTRSHQPFIYSNYSIFVAEVASNFHQAMLRAYLFESNPEPAFQLAVIDEMLSNFMRYFFIMPTLARFELEMHERAERGKSLTADLMTTRAAELFAEAYGPEVEIDTQRDGIVWAQFGHLLSGIFYPFQYTTGLSAANMLAQKVLHEGPDAAKSYRAFLEAGSSLYPLDALKLAGVDMTTPDAVETTFGVLAGMVDRLEALTASSASGANGTKAAHPATSEPSEA